MFERVSSLCLVLSLATLLARVGCEFFSCCVIVLVLTVIVPAEGSPALGWGLWCPSTASWKTAGTEWKAIHAKKLSQNM